MAEDKSSNEIPKQEIDLDEIEINLLIISKNAQALSSTANFLTRRGWPTTVMTNVSKAVEFIADKKPDYVLISINHPNPSIGKLPGLVQGTFNISCIGFAESFDTSSTAKLNNSKMRYKISGQASGPTVQRYLRKLLAEKLNIKIDDKGGEESPTSSQKGEGSVTIKGQGSSAADGGTIIQKSTASATKNQGANLIKGESKADEDQAIQNYSSASSTGKKRLKDIEANSNNINGGNEGDGGENYSSQEVSNEAQNDNMQPSKRRVKDKDDELLGEVSRAAPNANSEQSPGLDKEVLATGKYTMAKSTRRTLKELTGDASKAVDEATKAKQEEIVNMLKDSLRETNVNERASEELSDQTILEKIVESTLESVCNSAEEIHTPILNTMRVGVFPVESSKLPGYLVLATSLDDSAMEVLFKSAEQALVKEFKGRGYPGNLEPGFFINVPQVDFSAWADNRAEFKIVVNHEGSEIQAAFFATGKALPKIKDARSAGMVTLDISEVRASLAVNFKAYLHLPKNNKYYLYLRNGRILQEEQRKRLVAGNVRDFFMKVVDKENVRMYLASAFLSEMILEQSNKAAS